MKCTTAGLLLALVAAPGTTSAQGVTPLRKVVQLLKGMQEKGAKDRQEEQVQYAKYTQWCGDTQREKKGEVDDLGLDRDKHIADSEKAKQDAAAQTAAVKELQAELMEYDRQGTNATDVRGKEREEYVKVRHIFCKIEY